MKRWCGIAVLGLLALHAYAQALDVTFSINTSQDTARISPYIYGANSLAVDPPLRVAARRLGGNRMTGYNWENNASNAGLDYLHSSDDYMTWIFGIPQAEEDIPGITLTIFHDTVAGHVMLKLYDVLGREVSSLVNQTQTEGSHQVILDAADLASGVYVYTLTSDQNHSLRRSIPARRKLLVLK